MFNESTILFIQSTLNTTKYNFFHFFSFRYIAIVFQIKARFMSTKRRTLYVIINIWIFSRICAAPTAIFNKVVKIPGGSQFCLTQFYSNRTQREVYYILFRFTESGLFYLGPLSYR